MYSGSPRYEVSPGLDCPPAGELLPDALRPPPHRHYLHPSLTHLTQGELALDACLVHVPEHRLDGLGGGCMPEAVGARQAPVPVVPGIRLRVAGGQQDGSLHVAMLVANAQI